MGTSSAILSVGSAASSIISTRSAAKTQNVISDFNRSMAEVEAEDAIRRGALEEGRHRRRVTSLIGEQRVALAAQGLDVDFGSAEDLQKDVRAQGSFDALTIRNNARREAFGYKSQAAQSSLQGQLATFRARDAATGTLLTTGAGIGNIYRQRNTASQVPNSTGSRGYVPGAEYQE